MRLHVIVNDKGIHVIAHHILTRSTPLVDKTAYHLSENFSPKKEKTAFFIMFLVFLQSKNNLYRYRKSCSATRP